LLIIIPLLLSTTLAEAEENQLASSITTLARTITKQFGTIEAKVAAVDGDNIYINVGKKQYIKDDTIFEIIAEGGTFNDPVNRGKLGTLETHVADIKIVAVRDTYAIGQIINLVPEANPIPIKAGQKALEKSKKLKIAVVQFEYLNSKDIVTPRVAQQLMINELTNTGRFLVAESATTDKVVQQLLATQTPGANPPSPDTIGSVQFTRNLGKMLGVEYVMYGQLTDLPGFMELQCRVHEAQSGVGTAAANVQIIPTVIKPPPTESN
jgi:curli biogenesis system outer membrane secretion channel CsgG